MEPTELIEARNLLREYGKDNMKVNKLQRGLNCLYYVIEGECEVQYKKIATNILNSLINNILDESEIILLGRSAINLWQIDHLRDRIDKFIEAGFDDNSGLNECNERLKRKSVEIRTGLTQSEINELLE